jgi:hypothetical protein
MANELSLIVEDNPKNLKLVRGKLGELHRPGPPRCRSSIDDVGRHTGYEGYF